MIVKNDNKKVFAITDKLQKHDLIRKSINGYQITLTLCKDQNTTIDDLIKQGYRNIDDCTLDDLQVVRVEKTSNGIASNKSKLNAIAKLTTDDADFTKLHKIGFAMYNLDKMLDKQAREQAKKEKQKQNKQVLTQQKIDDAKQWIDGYIKAMRIEIKNKLLLLNEYKSLDNEKLDYIVENMINDMISK